MTNTKILWAVAVVALVLGLAQFIPHGTAPGFKGTVNYTNSGGSTNLYTTLASIVQDLQGVRAPLAGVVQTSTAAIAFPAISSMQGATTSTTPVISAQLKDTVLVGVSTSSPGIHYVAHVLTASTTAATIELEAFNYNGATTTPSSTVFSFTVIPNASFAAPAALVTVTSTSN